MVSAKAILFLIFVGIFIYGGFIVGARTGLFPVAGIDRDDMAAGAVLTQLPLAATVEIDKKPIAPFPDGSVASGEETGGSRNGLVLPPASSGDAVFVEQSGTTIAARAEIFGADEVLFYAQGDMLPVSLYLGRAIYDGDGDWSYKFDLNDRPLSNGRYRLYAEVTAGSNVYASSAAVLEVSLPSAARSSRSAAIEKAVRENQAAIAENKKAIASAVQDAAVSMIVLAGDNNNIRESFLLISELIREIKNDERMLTEKILERQDDSEIVRQFEKEITGMPENVISSIKSEKNNELKEAKDLAKRLDQEISDIQFRIEETNIRRQTIVDELAGRVPSGEAAAKNIINKFETKVSKQELNTIAKQEVLDRDSDGDGLSDEKEITALTDPDNPDSDGDGALDGDEAANGYDPLAPGGFKTSDYHDPRQTAPKLAEVYKLGQITSFDLADGGTGIRLEGNALPGAYTQVFIYSVPVITIVKADGQGRWSYDLDNELPDGRHSAYVALYDSQGGVAARSELAVFDKNGKSVFRTVTESESSLPPSVNDLKSNFGMYAGFAVLVALAIALLTIGFAARGRTGKGKDVDK